MHLEAMHLKAEKKNPKMQKTLDPASFERESMREKKHLHLNRDQGYLHCFQNDPKGREGRIGRIQRRPGKKRILHTERECMIVRERAKKEEEKHTCVKERNLMDGWMDGWIRVSASGEAQN